MDHFRGNWQEAKMRAVHEGLKIVEHGWEQHVIIDEVNGLVHRYPKHQAAADKLADEVAVLDDLRGLAWQVEIPTIVNHAPTHTTYRYIAGEVLSHHTLAHLHDEDIARVGASLGRTLATLHRAKHRAVEAKKTKQSTTLLEYYRARIENSLSKHRQPAEQSLNRLVASSPQMPEVVVHGDLHGLNIVINPVSRELAGIIDFSEAEIGNAHLELRKIFMTHPDLLSPAASTYQEQTDTAIDQEIVKLWAYVNEWANLCHFADQPGNATYMRARQHLAKWDQL